MARTALALGVAIAALFAARAAAADARQCVAASEKAQELRNAGKLTAAREQLAICGRSECPRIVAHDCAQWTSEVLAILPSIVPGAKDRRGRDLVDVVMSIDGKRAADTLDGKPLPIDPGVHTLRFETKGATPVDEKIVVRQGEKNRIVTVTLPVGEEAPAPKLAPIDVGHESDRRDRRETSSPPIAAYIVGGLGVVALGAAAFIALDADGDARRLRSECAPRCSQSDVDDIEQRRIIAGATAAAGGAMLVAGAVLFFMHPSSGSSTFAIAPLPGGASGAASFRF